MLRNILCVLVSAFFIASLTACISEADKADMRKMLNDSYSKDASARAASAKASQSTSKPSASPETSDQNGGSTQLDNKPPKQSSKSEMEKFNSNVSEFAKGLSEGLEDIPDTSYDIPTFSSRDDIVFNPSNKWKDIINSGRESDEQYPWENDANIPKYDYEIPIPEFSGQGDGDTGYRGGTVPDFSNSSVE